jgi:hypothetical protein
MFQIFKLFQTYVTSVFTKLFHLDVACFHLYVAYIVLVIHVCSKCFTYFRRVFQVFDLDIAYVEMIIYISCVICNQSSRTISRVNPIV